MAAVPRHVERSRLHGRAPPRPALGITSASRRHIAPARRRGAGLQLRPGDEPWLARLASYPCRCTSSGMMSLLGTTFAGANQIVQRLVEIGILREFTGQARHRRFRYDAYVRLFEEEA